MKNQKGLTLPGTIVLVLFNSIYSVWSNIFY